MLSKVTIRCCKCDEYGYVSKEKFPTIPRARGWANIGEQWFCPECATNERFYAQGYVAGREDTKDNDQ